ncbi:hypothetical protein [Mariniradius sediminis]|uniref:Uncharacterized protein n=1 Tax=Mariniradius sediminis TaxID=2909237 RepID=A0ABS9BNP7_9BACT|nr:hypothetical protein [Mariniradius sediminis]MCF1749642.1 hypothetical protein [Mariniradius sediminis]
MRKPIAILLLCCFALYHFGYYVAYFSFRLQVEKHWVDKIYSDSSAALEEKMMEIPLSIPYMVSEEEFRVANTSFEKDGQFFRIIKQRYVNDTLQVVYVPDTAKRTMNETIKLWVTSLVHDDLPDGANNTLLSKIFVKDYTQPVNDFQFRSFIPVQKHYIGFIFLPFDQLTINIHTPPPELG